MKDLGIERTEVVDEIESRGRDGKLQPFIRLRLHLQGHLHLQISCSITRGRGGHHILNSAAGKRIHPPLSPCCPCFRPHLEGTRNRSSHGVQVDPFLLL
jgi:hypothetical protein